LKAWCAATEIKRQQYSDLYKRASELETERRVLIGNTRLVSLAELPAKPFFPKKIPFIAAGATLGLLLAIVAAFFGDRAQSRRSVATPYG
jgi:succinoglycan biosynthesis transport protein ExoP